MSDPDAALRAAARRLDDLVELFTAAGHRLYLVGGAVRDALLGRRVDVDYDLTTDAPPDVIERLLEGWADVVWTQGRRFGTIGAARHGVHYEITTHREEAYDAGSRKPSVRFATRVEADLSRRDFTINAMALTLPGGELVDPFGGRADLVERRLLRTPLAPELSFAEDPLRLMRAARFVTRFGLSPAPGLVEAARALAHRIGIVSAERIEDELTRLLAAADPRPGLALLDEIGLLERILPEAADPSRSAEVLARLDAASPDDRLALLLAEADPPAVRARLRRLKVSNDRRRDIAALVEGLAAVEAAAPDAAAVRRLAARHGERLDRLVGLVAARDPERGRALAAAVADRRAAEDLGDLEPPLDGDAVMRLLGIEPGPEVGEALARLRELRLERGPLTAGEAEEELRRWWRRR